MFRFTQKRETPVQPPPAEDLVRQNRQNALISRFQGIVRDTDVHNRNSYINGPNRLPGVSKITNSSTSKECAKVLEEINSTNSHLYDRNYIRTIGITICYLQNRLRLAENTPEKNSHDDFRLDFIQRNGLYYLLTIIKPFTEKKISGHTNWLVITSTAIVSCVRAILKPATSVKYFYSKWHNKEDIVDQISSILSINCPSIRCCYYKLLIDLCRIKKKSNNDEVGHRFTLEILKSSAELENVRQDYNWQKLKSDISGTSAELQRTAFDLVLLVVKGLSRMEDPKFAFKTDILQSAIHSGIIQTIYDNRWIGTSQLDSKWSARFQKDLQLFKDKVAPLLPSVAAPKIPSRANRGTTRNAPPVGQIPTGSSQLAMTAHEIATLCENTNEAMEPLVNILKKICQSITLLDQGQGKLASSENNKKFFKKLKTLEKTWDDIKSGKLTDVNLGRAVSQRRATGRRKPPPERPGPSNGRAPAPSAPVVRPNGQLTSNRTNNKGSALANLFAPKSTANPVFLPQPVFPATASSAVASTGAGAPEAPQIPQAWTDIIAGKTPVAGAAATPVKVHTKYSQVVKKVHPKIKNKEVNVKSIQATPVKKFNDKSIHKKIDVEIEGTKKDNQPEPNLEGLFKIIAEKNVKKENTKSDKEKTPNSAVNVTDGVNPEWKNISQNINIKFNAFMTIDVIKKKKVTVRDCCKQICKVLEDPDTADKDLVETFEKDPNYLKRLKEIFDGGDISNDKDKAKKEKAIRDIQEKLVQNIDTIAEQKDEKFMDKLTPAALITYYLYKVDDISKILDIKFFITGFEEKASDFEDILVLYREAMECILESTSFRSIFFYISSLVWHFSQQTTIQTASGFKIELVNRVAEYKMQDKNMKPPKNLTLVQWMVDDFESENNLARNKFNSLELTEDLSSEDEQKVEGGEKPKTVAKATTQEMILRPVHTTFLEEFEPLKELLDTKNTNRQNFSEKFQKPVTVLKTTIDKHVKDFEDIKNAALQNDLIKLKDMQKVLEEFEQKAKEVEDLFTKLRLYFCIEVRDFEPKAREELLKNLNKFRDHFEVVKITKDAKRVKEKEKEIRMSKASNNKQPSRSSVPKNQKNTSKLPNIPKVPIKNWIKIGRRLSASLSSSIKGEADINDMLDLAQGISTISISESETSESLLKTPSIALVPSSSKGKKGVSIRAKVEKSTTNLELDNSN